MTMVPASVHPAHVARFAFSEQPAPFVAEPPVVEPGVHPSAAIDVSARVSPKACVGAFVSIGAHCEVGEGTTLEAGCVLGEGVRIGRDCRLYGNVSVYHDCVIGDRVILHSGAGEFLAQAALRATAKPRGYEILSLAKKLSPTLSAAASAYALAVLDEEIWQAPRMERR